MKILFALTVLVAGVSPTLAQKPKAKTTPATAALLSGLYEGNLLIPGGAQLHLVLHFDGKGAGTMDSPEQGARGMPLAKASLAKGIVTFTSVTPPFSFSGKRSADGQSIKGTFTQNGLAMELNLKKVAQATVLRRPQTPKPPFPYKTVEVSFSNPAEAGVTLGGTLSVPPGTGPFPCVVFITGSGQQDRDETIFAHKPFAVIADDLARRGIASLRCDDRMVGKSKGDVMKATSANFATDIEAAVAFLKTRPEVDKAKIGLIGHSEGGMIAPMVAAKPENGIAFIVLLAGTGVPGDQILLAQAALILKAQGASEASIASNRALQEKLLTLAKTESDPKKAREKAASLGITDLAQVNLITLPWMRYFIGYDPAPTLAKVTCPVLALNGSKDLQVPPQQNLPVIEKALKDGGNKDVTTLEIPGLNHLFQHAKTGGITEYSEIEESFSPDALKRIGEWTVAHTK